MRPIEPGNFWPVLLLGIACWGTSGCGTTSGERISRPTGKDGSGLSDKSLYQIESTWTTDTGKRIHLAELQGRPQVVVMFFTSCQYACPLIVHDLHKIEAALGPAYRGRVGYTLVTFDPRRDTPEALAAFRTTRGLPTGTWTLLHGAPDDILELAALLGVKYKEEATGQFAHSNLITVLNRQGEIVHQTVGLGQDTGVIVRKLRALPPD